MQQAIQKAHRAFISTKVQKFALETYSVAAEMDSSTNWDYGRRDAVVNEDNTLQNKCCISTHLGIFLFQHHTYLLENVNNREIILDYCNNGLFSSKIGIYLSSIMIGVSPNTFYDLLFTHGGPKDPFDEFSFSEWSKHPSEVWRSMVTGMYLTEKVMRLKTDLVRTPNFL